MNSSSGSSGGDWRDKCRQLLEIIWNSNDSVPFREPVDTIDHPGKNEWLLEDTMQPIPFEMETNSVQIFLPISDYLQVIDNPMDLRTVKEELLGCNYQSKAEFLKDMRTIFVNSRTYNTNTHSRVSLNLLHLRSCALSVSLSLSISFIFFVLINVVTRHLSIVILLLTHFHSQYSKHSLYSFFFPSCFVCHKFINPNEKKSFMNRKIL